MRAHEAAIAQAGAQVAFVGNGNAAMAAAFAREHAGAHPVLTDPTRQAFAAVGLRRGFWTTVRPSVLWHAWRALRRGFRQGGVHGDPWQQGGVVVLDRQGRIVHRQVDAVAGALLDLRSVLAALVALAAPAPAPPRGR